MRLIDAPQKYFRVRRAEIPNAGEEGGMPVLFLLFSWSKHLPKRRLNGHFGSVVWRDGVSMAILVPSCGGTASQWPFWFRHVAGRRLNGHFGLIMWRDGVSMVILVPSCGGTASQWPFWSRRVAGLRLNGHFGSVMRRDGVSMVILIPSCGGTASQKQNSLTSNSFRGR